jgi:hypothetical protein
MLFEAPLHRFISYAGSARNSASQTVPWDCHFP